MKRFRHYINSRKDHFVWNREDVDLPLLENANYLDHLPDIGRVEPSSLHQDDIDAQEYDHEKMKEEFPNIHKIIGVYKKSSTDFNSPLRRAIDGHIKNDIPSQHFKNLDFVTSVPLEHDTTLFRGISPGVGLHRLKSGDMFDDHGYTSTSFDPKVAHRFTSSYRSYFGNNISREVPNHMLGHNVVAKIHAPAGSKGHFIDVMANYGLTGHQHNEEKEFLLHRGNHFQITGHSQGYINGMPTHIIHMNLHHQEPVQLHFDND